jgi:hypothetical protein
MKEAACGRGPARDRGDAHTDHQLDALRSSFVSSPSREDVRARLASVVGDEEAERTLIEAERAMQVSSTWDAAASNAVIGYLTMQRGVVGAAARLLRGRTRPSQGALRAVGAVGGGPRDATFASSPEASGETPVSGVASVPSAAAMPTPASGVKRVLGPNAEKVVAMLSPAVGDERARDLLLETLQRRQVDPATLTAEQGLAALEELSRTPGPVGTAARFAKARAHFELA